METTEIASMLAGATLIRIEQVDPKSEEYAAYQINIVTDCGTLKITGCHDGGPDFTLVRSES